MNQIYESVKRNTKDPLSLILTSAIKEFNLVDVGTPTNKEDRFWSFKKKMFSIDQAVQITLNRIVQELNEYVSALGSVASVSPFIGLLGTVLGIINSFYSISLQKSVNISVIAPGISEALLVTAIGLFVAIPALIFYNYLNSVLNTIVNEIEEFSAEIFLKISRI